MDNKQSTLKPNIQIYVGQPCEPLQEDDISSLDSASSTNGPINDNGSFYSKSSENFPVIQNSLDFTPPLKTLNLNQDPQAILQQMNLDMERQMKQMQMNFGTLSIPETNPAGGTKSEWILQPNPGLSGFPQPPFPNFNGQNSMTRGLFPEEMSNFITQDKDGKKKLQMKFDVTGYKPEDIDVKTQGNVLEVNARHEEKDPTSVTCRVFHKHVELPKDVRVVKNKVAHNISPDGYLTLEGPVKDKHRVRFGGNGGGSNVPLEQVAYFSNNGMPMKPSQQPHLNSSLKQQQQYQTPYTGVQEPMYDGSYPPTYNNNSSNQKPVQGSNHRNMAHNGYHTYNPANGQSTYTNTSMPHHYGNNIQKSPSVGHGGQHVYHGNVPQGPVVSKGPHVSVQVHPQNGYP